jgi:hypothetical protein
VLKDGRVLLVRIAPLAAGASLISFLPEAVEIPEIGAPRKPALVSEG